MKAYQRLFSVPISDFFFLLNVPHLLAPIKRKKLSASNVRTIRKKKAVCPANDYVFDNHSPLRVDTQSQSFIFFTHFMAIGLDVMAHEMMRKRMAQAPKRL